MPAIQEADAPELSAKSSPAPPVLPDNSGKFHAARVAEKGLALFLGFTVYNAEHCGNGMYSCDASDSVCLPGKNTREGCGDLGLNPFAFAALQIQFPPHCRNS